MHCYIVCLLRAEDPGAAANKRAQSHEEVLGGRLAATTSFTINRMGKQQEEKLTGEEQISFYPIFMSLMLLLCARFLTLFYEVHNVSH